MFCHDLVAATPIKVKVQYANDSTVVEGDGEWWKKVVAKATRQCE